MRSNGGTNRRGFLIDAALAGIGAAVLASCEWLPESAPVGLKSVEHQTIAINGVDIHIAVMGRGETVLLLHGFPELWYSWRHQLTALAEAGYRVVAPDLRGYGGSSVPTEIEQYSLRHMTDDVMALLEVLDVERVTLVGHDWGANICWAFAELHPDRVSSIIALGVPYAPRSSEMPTASLRRWSQDRFNFALYFQRPGVAEAEFEADIYDTLQRFFFSLSGDAPAKLVDHLFRGKPASATALEGMLTPARPLAWMSAADLRVYADAFAKTGFRGALNRYRNLDRDWVELSRLGTVGVTAPTLFVAGDRDPALVFGSTEPMRKAVPNLRIETLAGCGHWTQQERGPSVSERIIAFLKRQ